MTFDDLRVTARVMAWLLVSMTFLLYVFFLMPALIDNHGEPWTPWITWLKPHRYLISFLGVAGGVYLMLTQRPAQK